MIKIINSHQWETRIVDGIHGAKKVRYCKLCNVYKGSTGNSIYKDNKEYASKDMRCTTRKAKDKNDYEEFKYIAKN